MVLGVKACLDEVNSIREKYSSFLKNIRELSRRAIKKLGLEKWNEGQIYINKFTKKNGKCYVYLEIHYDWKVKKVGLGPCEEFDKQKLYRVLRQRFGITKEEVNALFMMRKYKEISSILKRIVYHATRLEESINMLNLDFDNELDEQIEKVKQPVLKTALW